VPLPLLPSHPTIVILGAGFGGLYTARRLDALLKRRGSPQANVVLIDRHNYFLMTPLLFEAGSGVLEPRHAVSPIRTLLRRLRFVQATVAPHADGHGGLRSTRIRITRLPRERRRSST
jgi:NADH dehydrogenase FAD-containing subunit